MSVMTRSGALLGIVLSLFFGSSSYAERVRRNLYPNELRGFRFYEKYLAPLTPAASERADVIHVLGDINKKVGGWRIIPTYYGNGTIYEIIVRPEGVIPMAAVQFPSTFKHCHISVSEFNITLDTYKDKYGLEYWLHAYDSNWGHKGDLFRIVYGPPDRELFRPNMVC